MSFKKARKIINILFVTVMAVPFSGLILGDRFLPLILITVVALLFAMIYISATYFKCPHCNSGFNPRYFPADATHCPYCGGELE